MAKGYPLTLGELLAIIGVILAIYALAKPPQRKSIGLFVPLWVVIVGIVFSVVLVLILHALIQWVVKAPAWRFFLGTVAFLIPIGVICWAVIRWYRARLTKKSDPKFRSFLQSCISDGVYDEAVRVLTKNRDNLPQVITKDTADLVFDSHFVHSLVSARSWLHLELLTNDAMLKILPNYRQAVDRTIRELLVATTSPLRTSALLNEGGDENLHCRTEELSLIEQTFRNPKWFHKYRVNSPLVIFAHEIISSGKLDDAYNRVDSLYNRHQGVSPRSRCPVFLAIKTIAHALRASIQKNSGTSEDTHRDALSLLQIFRAILEHSKYLKETWDEPLGKGDYSTPFGFLLAVIIADFYSICEGAWSESNYGKGPPPEILSPVIRMWASCEIGISRDVKSVSPQFQQDSLGRLLEATLVRRHHERCSDEVDHTATAAWTTVYLDNIRDALKNNLPDSRSEVVQAVDGLDFCIAHNQKENRDWLCKELGLKACNK